MDPKDRQDPDCNQADTSLVLHEQPESDKVIIARLILPPFPILSGIDRK